MSVKRVMPVVTVDDLDAAVEGYRAVLGLDVVMNHGWIATLSGQDHLHQLSLMTRDATAPVNPAVSVEVDDVDAAYDAAVQAGLKIIHPLGDEDWGVRRFFFADGTGNVINVLSHRS